MQSGFPFQPRCFPAILCNLHSRRCARYTMTVTKMPNSLIRFEAFLREADNRARKRMVIDTSLLLSVPVFVGSAVLLNRFIIHPSHPSDFWSMFLTLAISWVISRRVYRRLERGKASRVSIRDPLNAMYIELIDELKGYSAKRTLRERLHPAVARQLEGSAEVFFRVRTWLKTPQSKSVLGNAIHKDCVVATDRAMREIIFSIHGAFRPKGMEKNTWDEMVASDPNAQEACETLSRISGLLDQLNEIMTKVESLGMTITLTDQLRAISDAIEELEQVSYAYIKSLPAPRHEEDQVSVRG